MTRPVKIVTHSGGFHADDVFAVATLKLMLGDTPSEIIRTRDDAVIATGDYVLDVGNVHDADANRFDHHQKEGAGERENGIPYASFGLLWKKFGVEVCGSQEIADIIDTHIVQPVDAGDNGVQIYERTHPSKIRPFGINAFVASFDVPWGTPPRHDESFADAVESIQAFLKRIIAQTKANQEAVKIIVTAYEQSADKKLVVIEAQPTISRILITGVLSEYPEPILFLRQHEDGRWQVVCVSDPDDYFLRRKDLPESWAGKRDQELVEVTGVPDAVFCHNKRFMAVAQSKEGALALAKLALEGTRD